MTHEYDEEEKKARSLHPPSTTATTSSRATTAGSPTQLPAWTREADAHLHEAERAVCKWLDAHVKKPGILSLTLSDLVQRVLDNVPAALKLSRVQVETIICEWATAHNIPIQQTVPPPPASSSTAPGKPEEKGQKKKDQ